MTIAIKNITEFIFHFWLLSTSVYRKFANSIQMYISKKIAALLWMSFFCKIKLKNSIVLFDINNNPSTRNPKNVLTFIKKTTTIL